MSALHAAVDPAAYQAVERLMRRHAWLMSHGQAGNLPNPCVEDGRVRGVGPDKDGRAAIAEWADGRQATMERWSRHV